MEQRTIERFSKSAILVHWLHTASFAVLLISGFIMFFNLTNTSGEDLIRTIHKAAAVFFVIVPVLFSLFKPKAALNFLKEAFRWDRDDIAWLRASGSFYFGRKTQMPLQGRINGGQRLWQFIVIITGLIFMLTGILLWFFKLKIPWMLYQGILFTHEAAFVVISLMFLVHFYVATIHPRNEESLGSMVDGKVSSTYAREHYRKWYEEKQVENNLRD